MQLISMLLACTREEPSTGLINDSSWPGSPFLEDAAARCDTTTNLIVISARLKGWEEKTQVDLWEDPSDPLGAHWSAELQTTRYRRDETCDSVLLVAPAEFGCDSLGTLTILLRSAYEEGCAGCVLSQPTGQLSDINERLSVCDPGFCVPDVCIPETSERKLESTGQPVRFRIGPDEPDVTPCPDNPQPGL